MSEAAPIHPPSESVISDIVQPNNSVDISSGGEPQKKNVSISDSYLQGTVPFEQYLSHLQEHQPEFQQLQAIPPQNFFFSPQEPSTSRNRNRSGSTTYLENIVGEIELDSSIEAEEIDFETIFNAERASVSDRFSAQRGKGQGAGAKKARVSAVSASSENNSSSDDLDSVVRKRLLQESSETQDLLEQYSESFKYEDARAEGMDIVLDDDDDSEIQAISPVEDDEFESEDNPDDSDYDPSESSGRGKRRGNTRGKGRGRRGKPPHAGIKGLPALSKKAAKKAEDEESIFGVPEEWRESDLNKTNRNDGSIRPLRKLPEHLSALMGQANLNYAQGRKKEALEMMEEVLRQKPKNPEPYQCLASIFEDMGEKEKQLQCGLLAAYLDYLTPANLWINLAHLADEVKKSEQAIACVSKAIRMDPQDWSSYALKLKFLEQLGDSKRALETKMVAVKGMRDTSDFVWYDKFVRETAELAFFAKDSMLDGIQCYSYLMKRYLKERVAPPMDLLEKYVRALMKTKQYMEAAKAIFECTQLCGWDSENKVAVNWNELNFSQQVASSSLGFPPLEVAAYSVPEGFPVKLLVDLVVCWIQVDRLDLAQPMITHLDNNGPINLEYLEIAQILAEKRFFDKAEAVLRKMLSFPHLANKAKVWLVYAEVFASSEKIDAACEAYSKVVELAPDDVEARVSLAALQQDLGQTERALDTLKKQVNNERFDCEHVEFKDERLLHKECLILYSQKKWDSFLKCAYRILAPFFYDIYAVMGQRSAARNMYRDKNGLKRMSMHVRRAALDVARDTLLERLVKKIGKALASSPASKQKNFKLLSMNDLNELSFKVCEVLLDQKRFEELTQVAGFSSNIPSLVIGGLSKTFEQIMLLGAVLGKNAKVAFQLLHSSMPDVDRPRLWNLYGLIFVLSQDVSYHRIILRYAAKNPDTAALTILSGNNSLISGTYQHALSEYLVVLADCPSDPLVNLLTGLTCLHLACKKDIARRHDICLQGFAFLSQYEQLRSPCQETLYNLGRAMQQANVLFAAVHYYKKVLECEPMEATSGGENEEKTTVQYDLKPLAAHNLALIYQNSNNPILAREVLEKYCTV